MRFLVGHAASATSSSPNLYVVEGDQAFNVTKADPTIGVDLAGVVTGGAEAMAKVQAARKTASNVPVSSLAPALPLSRPGKIICLGLNYADHAKEGGHDVPDYPALFMRGATTLVPAEGPVVRPDCSERLDYEVELMVIIGKGGKGIEILIIGGASYLVFAVFSLNYAALLGLLVGFSVIVPYIGATLVTIPVVVVAYAQFGVTPDFFWVFGAYAVIQVLDGNVLVPLLFSEAVNLHPVAIVIAVLFFGGLWGLWGVFFAIPLATLVNAILSAWPSREALPSA